MKRILIIWILSMAVCLALFFYRYPGKPNIKLIVSDQSFYALDRINGELVVVGMTEGLMARGPQPEVDNAPWRVQFDPWIKIGPWPKGIEFYEQRGTRLLISTQPGSNPALKTPQTSEIEIALQSYFDQSGRLKILPHKKKITKTSLPKQTRESWIRIGLYLFMSIALTTIVEIIWKTKTKHQIKKHISSGLCVHCSYKTKGLFTATCPECGQPHTVPTESPIHESNA